MINIPLDMIVPNPNNPRKDFSPEGLAELTASIRSMGVVQPIVVVMIDTETPTLSPTYRIIAGERRWRAAKEAGLTEIPAVIKSGLTEAQELEIMVVENLQRKDVNPIEEANGFKLLLDTGLKQEELAERLGKSQSHIANRVRLLELPESVLWNISRGIISVGQAKEILVAKKFGPEFMERLGERVAEKKLAVRDIASEIIALREEIAIEREIAANREREKWLQEELARQEAEKANEEILTINEFSESFVILTEPDKCGDCTSKKLAKLRDGEKVFDVCISPVGCPFDSNSEEEAAIVYAEQSCVWNDVMLFEQDEDVEPEQEDSSLKEFYGQVSVVARISFRIRAESEEEAKEKLFKARLPLDLTDDDSKPVCEVEAVDWHMVDELRLGNVRESNLDDFFIEEEIEAVNDGPETINEPADPVWTMKNTFLYTAKCPPECSHVVRVIDQGQPFWMCKNGECELNRPEIDATVTNTDITVTETDVLVTESNAEYTLQNTMNTHFDCPDECRYKVKVMHLEREHYRCSNPKLFNDSYTEDPEEKWGDCRGVFDDTEHIPNVEGLPVKENPDFEPKSTHNIHDNCPDGCMFRIPASAGIKRDRCGNGEFNTPCKNWAEFEENSKLFRACRGFSAPAKEKSQSETSGLVSADAEQISPSDRTCHYEDNDGRILFVTYGAAGKAYRTFYCKDGEEALTCMKSTSMPYVETRKEAEANLVEYAEKRGWKKVGQDEPRQAEADPFDQPREFADKVHALMGKHIKTPYGTGGVVVHVVGPLEDGFYSLTYKNQFKSDNYINSIALKDDVILCEGVPLSIEKDESGELAIVDRATRLLSLPLDSDEYKFLLGSVSEKELDMALFRDMRESGKFRIQAEKDRRLLELMGSQLVNIGGDARNG